MCALGFGFRLCPANPGWDAGAWVFLCALRLYPANPGWGVRCGRVCLGSGFVCPPLFLAGVLGCVDWRAQSACTPPILAWVCGVGVCAWAQVSGAPRHSWLECWVVCFGVRTQPVPHPSRLECAVLVCMLGLGFRLRPAISGWGAELFVLVCALRLYPANPGWGVRCGCMCLGSGLGCAPPYLSGVFGCVCLCARSACIPPNLAGVCGEGVCAWARVRAAPRHSLLGCWVLCFGVCAPHVPRHPWLGCAVWVCVPGLGFRLRPAIPGWGSGVFTSACALRLYPAFPGWELWCVGWLLPGTCSPAVVRCVVRALSRFTTPGGRYCLANVSVPWLLPAAFPSGVPPGPAWCAAPRPV